jgi:outer membrane protein assembly factor BamB
MPADLDEYFDAFGAYTDSAPVRSPDRARRRGQQRTRRQLAATGLAVVLVIGSVVIGATRFQRHDPPTTPATPAPPVRFMPLQPLGAGVDMDLGQGGGYGMTAVVGDRAFVGARTASSRLQINAIDLKTGDPLWSTVDLGSFGDWNGLLAGPEAVVAIGEHDDGTSPDHVLMVLDPETGAKRWETGFDDLDLEWYDIGAVLPSRTSVRALDWRTGAELWQIPVPDTYPQPAFQQNVSTADAATAPAMLRGLDPTDHRFFMIEPSGLLHRYDAATGLEQEVVPNVGPPAATRTGLLNNYFLFDDQLFSLNDDQTQAYRYDLRNPAGLVPIYTAADQSRIRSVTACGPDRACVVTRHMGDQPNTLNLVDLASGRTLWQAEVEYVEYGLAAGDAIITDRGNLFDATSGRRFDQPSTVFGGWVTPGGVLTFTASTGDQASIAEPNTVFGISTMDGSAVSLGQIGPLAGYCGWSTTVLVCPTAEGFRAWRFAI